MSQSKHTIRECLESIGIVSDDDFAECLNVQEEFQVVKRKAHECFLRTHPDKGGSPAEFRKARTSFEVLRDLFDKKKVSTFQGIAVKKQNADSYNAVYAEFGDVPTPSWDYFYAAASEVVPLYRIEVAKSGRSRCVAKSGRTCTEDPKETCLIAKGEVRIGSMLADVGSYTRFVHLECWRVPNRVWEGLPNPEECDDPEKFSHALRQMNEVILVGFSELSEEQQDDVVNYVMDKSHWARKTKKRGGLLMSDGTNNGVMIADGTVVSEDAVGQYESRGMVPAGPPRERFVMPVPGKNGAIPNALEGKTVVLTGVFPEVGGGVGLNLGKDRVKAMVESFGGRVTGSVSGKTDVLIVGKDPGFSKVSKARERPKCQLVSLKDLTDVLHGSLLEDAAPAAIEGFSSGFGGNSLAATADKEAMAIALGMAPPKQIENGDKKPAAKKRGAAAASDDGDKKPAAKRAKKGKAGAKKKKKTTPGKAVFKAIEAEVVPPKTKKGKKKAPAVATVVSKDEPESEDESLPDIVSCDSCGVDCTKSSYFIEATEEDFCLECYETCDKEGVLQENGENVDKEDEDAGAN